ncbi:SDR family oxidoreductase [Frigidibacter sp. MR17.14]|uniref:SDR family NAD(P)-dependent oxidoreductase n=1 Tax=Frigidibacter sp. MR17.14 TaxID=3126509 RepID=UPI003012A9CB
MTWLGLEGARVVVTGAGGGIGQALATAFAEAGARLALLDRTEAPGPEGALHLACDMARPDEVAAAARAVTARLGGVDVLVNTAAILRPGALETVAVEDWRAMLEVNLTGYLVAAQEFGRAMLAAGQGAIVHVASIAASHPQPASGAYSPGKAAVAMLSRQLAAEWGPRGVRSNVVSPGLVRTPLSEAFYADPEVRARREAMVPLRRIAAPQDMAGAVLFLASPRAAYVTGQEIVVDGGLSQSLMGLVPRPGYA